MNIDQKIKRSMSKEKINFAEIGCTDSSEKLVVLEERDKLVIEPIWMVENDPEGAAYRRYISENPSYADVWVRQSLRVKLYKAAASLPENWQLVVRAGHRPLKVQLQVLHDLKQSYLKENPLLTEGEALTKARIFVSDPAEHLPPHCCGAAVDVDARYVKTGLAVDFGCPVNTDEEISYLHTEQVSKEQHANRLILLTVMLNAGFASDVFEWWHYSYGDQLWAWFYQYHNALYGIVEPNL